jgi:tRNA(fMet)-specific endonuclease VapC
MNEVLWFKAGELSALVKKQGKTIPLSDILIASLALEHDLTILTVDKHVEQIPGLKLYTLRAK